MSAIVLDALGTLFDLAPLRERLGEAALEAWFERTLHSAATLTIIGDFVPFAELAEATLRTTAARLDLDVDVQAAVSSLRGLPAAPDAREALEQARAGGRRVGVLTNGGRESGEQLLRRNGLLELVDEVVGVDEVSAYKPDPRPYRLAVERLGEDAGATTLVAAHAWDVLGARSAGLAAVWVDRHEQSWPFPTAADDLERAADLVEAVRRALR